MVKSKGPKGGCCICGGPHRIASPSKRGGKSRGMARPEFELWKRARGETHGLNPSGLAGQTQVRQILSKLGPCLEACLRTMDQSGARQVHEAVSDAAWPHRGSDSRKRKSHGTLVFKNRFTPSVKEQDEEGRGRGDNICR